jgi:hypothetical protein
MRTRLRIKGKYLWSSCALILLALVFSFCHTKITSVTQPATAVVGDVINIDVAVDISTNYFGGVYSGNVIVAVLMPKGWHGKDNMTATYTSSKGNGNMTFTPLSTIAPNTNGLTWTAALKSKFQTAGNLIDDVEWVVMQTDVPLTWQNGDKIIGHCNIKLKVAADSNPTLVKMAYLVAQSLDGLKDDPSVADGAPYGPNAVYYNEFIGDCFSVTGGTGDLVDFCNPQLTTIDPPKSLDNDFVTLAYNNTVTTTALNGAQAVYLCATATTSDGKTISVCEQTDKTKLTQTGANTGLYKLTFWPRKFFGVTDGQTIVSMTYYITNQGGNIKVGYGNTSDPFTFRFKCT